KTMNEQGYKPNIMIGKATAYIDPSFITTVGPVSNGITTAAEFNPGSKGVEISDAFKAEYNVNMNGHSAEAYTATWIMKTAIEQAGSTDKAALQKALQELKIDGSFPGGSEIILPYNKIEFSSAEFDGVKHTNTNTGAVLTILQIQNGKYETVWPFDIATAEPVIPAIFG
ncbi:MAG: ABC transporter substrate-binding protein, partial [Oscillospiraceae bacterium]